MGVLFSIIGRILSVLTGALVTFAGAVWILQAFNIAFNGPMGPGGQKSFMVSDHQWAIYGAIAAVLGLWQIAWSLTRKG
ncbi:MAG TPA: hypothetical protein VG983_04465 [Caulobacterales bacterium]|jgi:hypothetical protein|nr:hypothetical protein [Caulobacterales bacterium]